MFLYMRLRTPLSSLSIRWTPITSPNSFSSNHPKRFWGFPVNFLSSISLHNNGFQSFCHAEASNLTGIKAEVGEAEDEGACFDKLKRKIEAHGINSIPCTPGQYDLLYCPECKGGESLNRTLSFHISQNWSCAMWRCFHLQCGWAGKVFAGANMDYPIVNRPGKVKSSRPLTLDSVNLKELDDELLAYFSERKISKETLQRNKVMQIAGDHKTIAFTYRRNGVLVGCKFRTVTRRFWQVRNTDKTLYGVDDIAEADEIIIVEGEMDKLSFEEAGYFNCVSVPSGAPQSVSLKELPPPDKDTRFQYLWNCRDYFSKASRIVLATDSDAPGHALAEELSRRLGRERCWKVHWPKKDEDSSFKDANEVLMHLGADALRDAVEKAESLDKTQN